MGRPTKRAQRQFDVAMTGAPRAESLSLGEEELVAAVCNYFCQGHSVSTIARLVTNEYGTAISREDPYRLLAYAAKRGWLRFVPPKDSPLAEAINAQCEWLEDVDVVHGVGQDVARRSASMLMKIIREQSRPPLSRREIHVGWSGGDSMARIALELARMLAEPGTGLPDRLVLHALVSGFDIRRPMTDPSAFFTHFMNPALQVEVAFVGLHAPAVIRTEDAEDLLKLPGIREARDAVVELDIVVTSAASLADEHGMLRRYFRQVDDSGAMEDRLHGDGCVGDMLWLPLGKNGPIDNRRHPYRGLTIVELETLPNWIQRGKKVLLALGTCGLCGRDKGDILDVILRQTPSMITHLVADSRTARSFLQARSGEQL